MPAITKPTRITDKSATLIDNIFSNNMETESIQGILYTGISDHLPVFLIYSDVKVNVSPKREFIFKRSLSPDNVARFCIALNAIDWNSLLSGIDKPQLAFSIFHTRYSLLYNRYFPLIDYCLTWKL